MVAATCLAASAAGLAIAESARAPSQLKQSSVSPQTLKRVRLACARAAKRRVRAPGLARGSALRYAGTASRAQRSLLHTAEAPVGRAKARRPGKRRRASAARTRFASAHDSRAATQRQPTRSQPRASGSRRLCRALSKQEEGPRVASTRLRDVAKSGTSGRSADVGSSFDTAETDEWQQCAARRSLHAMARGSLHAAKCWRQQR